MVTTGGGLYRYHLGDRIQVTGHIHGCPLVRFVGRHSSVSDWFGEKLNDAHVSRVLNCALAELGIVPPSPCWLAIQLPRQGMYFISMRRKAKEVTIPNSPPLRTREPCAVIQLLRQNNLKPSYAARQIVPADSRGCGRSLESDHLDDSGGAPRPSSPCL